jgi:hypothetical protein
MAEGQSEERENSIFHESESILKAGLSEAMPTSTT